MFSHRNHVTGEGGPNEFATNPRACRVNDIAALRFKSHQGAATSNASKTAFHCEASLGIPSSRRCPTASHRANTGITTAINDAFANKPVPMAKPKPTQLSQCSEAVRSSTPKNLVQHRGRC